MTLLLAILVRLCYIIIITNDVETKYLPGYFVSIENQARQKINGQFEIEIRTAQ